MHSKVTSVKLYLQPFNNVESEPVQKYVRVLFETLGAVPPPNLNVCVQFPVTIVSADPNVSPTLAYGARYNLSKITRVIRRRYLLSQRGLEIFFGDDDVLYLSFPDAKKRSEFYAALTAQSAVVLKEEVKGNIMLKWQNGEMSNYDYLMHLNNFADRSFNDLTQYVSKLHQHAANLNGRANNVLVDTVQCPTCTRGRNGSYSAASL